METFLKVSNFKTCLERFQTYMDNEFHLDVASVKGIEKEKLLFEIMKIVKTTSDPSHTLHQLNNIALNKLRDVYVDKLKLYKANKPMVKQLSRDSQLFGNRPLSSEMILPINTNVSRSDVAQSFDFLLKSRDNENKTVIDSSKAPVGTSEDPLDINDFQKQLSLMEKTRESDYMNSSIDIQNAFNANDDPKTLYEVAKQPQGDQPLLATPPVYVNHAQNDIIPVPPSQKKITIEKYVTINGFDRNWSLYPMRYNFAIDMAQLARVYKNISSIWFTSLILPMEIVDDRSILNAPKYTFNHQFKIDFPYLMLQVDELSDVYDGLNQQVQKCTTMFVYDNAYKADNGRGYVIMRPLQNETKTFTPQLQTLQHLTFRLIKPNGTFLNESKDAFSVIRIDYTTYNELYLQVTLDQYFDKNEFFVGDTIMIKNYSVNVANHHCISPIEFTEVGTFINRTIGHEIIRVGEANEHGYTNNFYINAPSEFSPQTGRKVLNKCTLDAIRAYNDANPINMHEPSKMSDIINMSLQNVLTFTMSLMVNDIKGMFEL